MKVMTQERLKALGIEADYFTCDGQLLHVRAEVLAQLANILALPDGEAGIEESFVITADRLATLALPAAGMTLQDEQGKIIDLPMSTGDVRLPPLPMGYYTLSNTHGQRYFLISAPPQAFEPPRLKRGGKATGMNIQLYSLRSQKNWGIGDFGDLRALIADFADDGVDFIGLNPLHALFISRPQWASPYSPTSRLWLNVIYLDVPAVPEFRLSAAAQIWWQSSQTRARIAALRDQESVDYEAVLAAKMEVLRLAYDTFALGDQEEIKARRKRFARFVEAGGDALYHHALFEALDVHFSVLAGTRPFSEAQVGWLGWPQEYHDPQGVAVRDFARRHADEVQFYLWLQWLADEQLSGVKAFCAERGMSLGLYGDMAVGVSRGGSDTWMNRKAFCLQASIGAPPDPLGPAGQNWNLPPWHPHSLKRSAYAPFIAVLRANMRYYGIVRIDHVMALYRLWWIAYGHEATDGAYVRYPLQDLIAILAVESHRARCVVVGEDLGTVPDEVRHALHRYGIYSFSVLYFMKQGEDYLHPDHYRDKALATISTHDLPPLLSYWQENDLDLLAELAVIDDPAQYNQLKNARETDKKALLRKLRRNHYLSRAHGGALDDELILAVHVFVANSRSQLFALQPENLLPVSKPFNIPGVADGYPNWRIKLPGSVETMARDSRLHHMIREITTFRQPRGIPEMKKPAPSKSSDAKSAQTASSPYGSVDKYLVDQLFIGHATDPFAYLGAHKSSAGCVIRAFLPDAESVTLLDGDGKVLSKMGKVDDRGFFSIELPNRSPSAPYRFRVRYGQWDVEMEDPYRFPPSLSDLDNWLLAEGTHLRPYEKLGAHFHEREGVKGVHFSIWAPNALRVSVVGDFNHWDGRRNPMRLHPGSGVWEIFLPGAKAGMLYKFEILDGNGHIHLKADPYAFAAQFRPDTASVISGLPAVIAADSTRRLANNADKPISVYEVHLGSWRRNPENNYWLDYDAIADELIPYVKDMGFTHIELMPVSEFPFDGSWGYQPIGLYAPTSRFGSPEGLRSFIAKAHAAGINVLLDWVVGHFPTDEHGLARFDGTALYEHADPREGYHQDWNTLIFNYGRHEVRNYLTGNALYWIERFGIDGLRVDAVASMIYRDYSREEGQWIPNQYGGRENLEAVDFLRHTNGIVRALGEGSISIAEESTSFTGVTHAEGLGFDYKWNMGWMNDTLSYIQKDPVHRKYHHNLLTFGMIYQYSERFMLPISHDEVVHGKGSLLSKMPGDCWQQFANLRAYYGYMWGYPGKKLLFMGCEFAQGREWNYGESLDWFLLEEGYGGWHKGMQDWVRDLNHFYQQTPALYARDFDPSGFEWLVVDDAEQSVLAFMRKADDGHDVIVVSNFTPVPRENYRIGVYQEGSYREALNSDAACYQGSNMGNGGQIFAEAIPAHGKAQSLSLTLPPLSTLFIIKE